MGVLSARDSVARGPTKRTTNSGEATKDSGRNIWAHVEEYQWKQPRTRLSSSLLPCSFCTPAPCRGAGRNSFIWLRCDRRKHPEVLPRSSAKKSQTCYPVHMFESDRNRPQPGNPGRAVFSPICQGVLDIKSPRVFNWTSQLISHPSRTCTHHLHAGLSRTSSPSERSRPWWKSLVWICGSALGSACTIRGRCLTVMLSKKESQPIVVL